MKTQAPIPQKQVKAINNLLRVLYEESSQLTTLEIDGKSWKITPLREGEFKIIPR